MGTGVPNPSLSFRCAGGRPSKIHLKKLKKKHLSCVHWTANLWRYDGVRKCTNAITFWDLKGLNGMPACTNSKMGMLRMSRHQHESWHRTKKQRPPSILLPLRTVRTQRSKNLTNTQFYSLQLQPILGWNTVFFLLVTLQQPSTNVWSQSRA